MPGYKRLNKELDALLYNYGLVKDCKIFERFLEYYFQRITLAQFLTCETKTLIKKVGDTIELKIDGDLIHASDENWKAILLEFAEFLEELKKAKDPLLQHYQNICKNNPLIQKRSFKISHELDQPNSIRGQAIKKLHDGLLKFNISLANTNIIAIVLMKLADCEISENILISNNKSPLTIHLSKNSEFITFFMPEPHAYVRALNHYFQKYSEESCSNFYLSVQEFEKLTNTIITHVKEFASARHSYIYSCLVEQSKQDPDISSLPTLQSYLGMYQPRRIALETPSPEPTVKNTI